MNSHQMQRRQDYMGEVDAKVDRGGIRSSLAKSWRGAASTRMVAAGGFNEGIGGEGKVEYMR